MSPRRLRWTMIAILTLCAPASIAMAQSGTLPAAIAPQAPEEGPAGAAKATPLAPRPPLRQHKASGPRTAAPPLGAPVQTADAVRIALLLTILTLIPTIAICMTPFVRIIVVLSMIRHAFGMPETPPNQVLVSLALLLTAFTMTPSLSAINATALQPFLSGALSVQQALDQGAQPLRAFMLRQVSDDDLKTVYDIAKQPLPAKAADVATMPLTTAFMLNELRVSFKIGFVVLLPFLLIDLVVSSILLSLGMLMVPPSTLSLPLKVLMFVLINGWSLVLEGVIGSFK
ncbi:MAG: flagellar type III secretion system pore protein FliP [Caulobacteraceae bacterium]|nr:flagellar type III secretion system pore protein FliP [Caulobacteraceae bacterium]